METPPLDPSVVRWSAPADDRTGRPTLVLLHGYGADEHDLFALANALPEEFVIAAVRAPLAPPWPMPGASWYPIEGLDGRSPERVTHAAERLIEWIDDAGLGEVGLLGFSQGGSVLIQAMRLAPERFAFGVMLSGYAAGGALPGDAALAERRPHVFWGRGSVDEVIPQSLVADTVDWLPGHVELSGRVYPGLGHGISQDELDDVVVFLTKRLADLEGGSTTDETPTAT